ncbi:hypothetical protein WOSG25_100410 [Weissella oryzae SG25]|uniref:Uncharacterized protein n=1 Tax=Weissella oryzae (strain DSM 25784 / JCM 18191 / LMG 30913 / SG25) TaxID=1329250 RepID=A0A069CUJ6_WEIOS|nr:hypothetical protein [Weissella oryzae]GAK31475.1 hypothetical protein WOSG25_100410 [Weissella oryzae SG25]
MAEYYLEFIENGEIPLETKPAYFAGFNVYHRLNMTSEIDEALKYSDKNEIETLQTQLNEVGFTVKILNY